MPSTLPCSPLRASTRCYLSFSLAPVVSASERSVKKKQQTFTPQVLTGCTLYKHSSGYLTLLVVYEHLIILKTGLALIAM
jgi:hypothetical protein